MNTNAVRPAAEHGDHVTSDQFTAGLAEVRTEIAEVRTEMPPSTRVDADRESLHAVFDADR